MKKISVYLFFILFATFTLAAANESDVILQAQMDAKEDDESYRATWWSISAVVFPMIVTFITVSEISDSLVYGRESDYLTIGSAYILTSSIITLAGYFLGIAEVPEARIIGIQDKHDDPYLMSLYKSEYEKTFTKIQRRKRGEASLMGIVIGVPITVFVGAFFYALLD
jgi:hypothetical protein